MKKLSLIILLCASFMLILGAFHITEASGLKQQPTILMATVTGTPKGITAAVSLNQDDPVNVRSGPGTFFDKVGVILPGQEVPVLGRTSGGEWVMIQYQGAPNNIAWVYSDLVIISPGELPIIEPPPTVTPLVTETINATLAAQFISTPNPTRLATFTPVDPLMIPTYEDVSRTSFLGRIPMGLVIIILGGLGGLLAIFSAIRAS